MTELKSLLVFRLILLNACVLAFFAWAYAKGLVQWLFGMESTGIGYALVALAVFAIGAGFHRAIKVTRAFDSIKAGKWVDVSKFRAKSFYVGRIAFYLMLMGLEGNILGFLLAFSEVDFNGGPDTILASINAMSGGFKIAFANSFIGTGLAAWVYLNSDILGTATTLLRIDADRLRGKL